MTSMGDSGSMVDIIRRHTFRGMFGLPEVGVEIGVHRGETSACLLKTFEPADLTAMDQETGQDVETHYLGLMLYMVDPWAVYPAGHSYRQSGDGCSKLSAEQQQANWQAARCITSFARERRTILRLTSEKANKRLGLKRISFVSIDGDHTYEAVTKDRQLWWPRIESGGLMLGHDIDHPRDKRGVWGVRKAVEEAFGEGNFNVSGNVWWKMKPEGDQQ